jgi:phage baseplate assembly protein W
VPTPLPYKYRDLNLLFIPNPITSDISAVVDEEAVKDAVLHLIFTDFYERPFHPEIGSNVRHTLFEPITSITALTIQKHISNVIDNFEPRVTVLNVAVVANADQNGYTATITFYVNNIADQQVISFFLERVR